MDGVRFEVALAGLKTDLANGKPIFQELLQKYLINNEHSVTVEMKPDTGESPLSLCDIYKDS